MAMTAAERMRKMRERQAAAGVPQRNGGPRDAAELLAPAVAEAIAALDLDDSDAAAAKLAMRYAETIDASDSPGWAYRWLAPQLLDTLDALGASPRGRARLKLVKPAPPRPPSRLDQLREQWGRDDVARRTGRR